MITPLFITPLVYKDWDVNSRINSTLIDSLPHHYSPVIIGSSRSKTDNQVVLIKPCENIFVRFFLRYGPNIITKNIIDKPDPFHYTWYNNAICKADFFLKSNKVSYIHSISYPYSSHLVALELKQKYNLPWIAHFFEPWMDSPFFPNNDRITKSNKLWERSVAQYADIIIHNSDEMCKSWKERYGDLVDKKLFKLPMPIKFPIKKDIKYTKKKNGVIRLCHIGNFYGARRAKDFLILLNKLFMEDPQLKNFIHITFVGSVPPEDVDLIKQLKMESVISLAGTITEEQCIPYYLNSDIFLVIESPKQGLLFFPSKTIRYFYYDKPILGITLKNSVLFNLLYSNGHFAFQINDYEGIKQYIIKAVRNYESLLDYNREAWMKYDIANVIQEYSKIVEKQLIF